MVNRLPWVLCAVFSALPFALARHIWVNLTSRNRTLRATIFRQPLDAEEPEQWNETILRICMSSAFAFGGLLMLASGIYVALTI